MHTAIDIPQLGGVQGKAAQKEGGKEGQKTGGGGGEAGGGRGKGGNSEVGLSGIAAVPGARRKVRLLGKSASLLF